MNRIGVSSIRTARIGAELQSILDAHGDRVHFEPVLNAACADAGTFIARSHDAGQPAEWNMNRLYDCTRILAASICFGLLACGGVASSTDSLKREGNPCSGNAHCGAGLVCRSGACVNPDDFVEAPSCVPGGSGRTDCGDGTESCCASPLVAGGMFFRTYTNGGSEPVIGTDPAVVSSFRLDKYEVTVGRFRTFVAAMQGADGGARWLPPSGSGVHTHLNHGNGLAAPHTGYDYEFGWDSADNDNLRHTYVDPWQSDDSVTVTANLTCNTLATWTLEVGSNEKLPINCVTWYDAYAFCIWDGGFLPSEAEWECAAAAGSQQREYPWGAIPPGATNQYAIYACQYPSGSGPCSAVSNIAPVGTATEGAGLWGQVDLAGNVWEWNLDYYNEWYVQPSVGDSSQPCVDCVDLDKKSPGEYPHRVGRGGDFASESTDLLSPWRRGIQVGSTGRSERVGIRCARFP